MSTDVPKNTGVGTVTTNLTVPHDRKIRDLNILDISLSLSQADDIMVGLTSPSGTFAILWEGVCGADVWDQSNTGFDLDDFSPLSLGSVCPPGSASYSPSEPLSMFNGESAKGTWTLTIADATPQPTQGILHGWGLQITFPILWVTSTGDSPDANTADGVCDDGTGQCTLRAAIQQANANPGPPDAIVPEDVGIHISTASPLPAISDAVTIWGDPSPRNTTLDGFGAGAGADGIFITGADVRIDNLRIIRFGGDAVEVSGRSNTLSGTIIRGNTGNGVKISGSTATANRVEANEISGNSGNGVEVSGSTATNNRIERNQIIKIVDEDGNVVSPGNGGDGVLIDNAPSNVVTGGTIQGNQGSGIHIRGSGATGNQIFDLATQENDLSGVFIDDASENEIGPTMAIGGNLQAGVRISGNSFMNVVRGSQITTHLSGVLIENGAFGNTVGGSEITTNRNGVVIEKGAQSNIVGGTDPADRNIISANSANGVVISGSNAAGNRIEGNYIGTDSNGTSLDGNAADGVLIDSAPNNTVGGSISGRNIISGNEGHGVRITGLNATGNQIAGNYIGLDTTGQSFLGNNLDGVHIDGAPSNVIGGDMPGFRNVISGNGRGSGLADGVEIEGAGATGNKVQANYIGTDSSGAVPRPNSVAGVVIRSSSNIVGGSSVDERNVISGNVEGVSLDVGATGNQVIGNYIGTDAAGAYAIGNNYGVRIFGASNVIGGSGPGDGNLISGNVFDGVSILGTTATSNAVRGNAIVDNGGLGIELGGNGITSNDSGDGDTGPNDYQNYAVLSSAISDGNITAIEGVLNTKANTQLEIEFYSNPSCDPSGNGEGKNLIGMMAVITDGNGNANFLATLAGGTPTTHHITATATDLTGNTSEFSPCKAVREAQADLSITKTDPPGRAPTGRNLTYTLTVTNVGPDMASAVTVVDQLPSTVTFVSASWRNGTCVHSSGTVTCDLGLVVGTSTETIDLVVKPRTPGTITNTASVSSPTRDPNGNNNSDSESTTVCRITSRKSSIPCP